MFPKRLLVFMLLFALTLMGAGEAHAQWEKINGPKDPSVNSFCGIGNNLFAVGYISTDQGNTWNASPYPLVVLDSTIVGSGGSVSTDCGINWSQSNLPGSIFYSFIVQLGNDFFASTARFAPGGCDSDVFRSTDKGKTWSVVFNGLLPVVYSSLAVFSDNRLIFAGSSDDDHYACYESDNLGTGWESIDSTIISCCGKSNGPYYPSSICCLAPTVVTQIGTALLGIDSGRLYSSTDDEVTWKLVGDLQNDSVISAATLDNNLFVCAKGGNLFLSTDTGVSWERINNGLIDSTISFVVVTDKYLFAANINDSLWRRPLSDFGIAAVSEPPKNGQSVQIFPNPFSGSTTISFSSETSGYADVSIANALGAEVAHLYSGELATGEHSFTWSDPNICNGMYECLVRMNGVDDRSSTMQSAGFLCCVKRPARTLGTKPAMNAVWLLRQLYDHFPITGRRTRSGICRAYQSDVSQEADRYCRL